MEKKFFIIITTLIVASAISAQSFELKTKNNRKIAVEVCNDRIFRIKITTNKDFAESLMERYGILKTDWSNPNATLTESSDSYEIKTKTNILHIDKQTGTITATDTQGKNIIDKIQYQTPNDKICTELAQIINDKFGNLNVASNGGIIGDDDGSISEKDKTESGDVEKSSVISISLKDGERFYGGGGTSREHIQHRGELLRMWTTYQHTEIPIPFVMSSNNWGIYNNTTRKNFFDIGSYQKDVLSIYNTCNDADFYLMFGNSMPDILNEYTLITGRNYVLPKWAYGLCFGPNMLESQFDILSDAIRFRQAEVPCDLLWLEPQWMEKRYDFSAQKKWNYKLFSAEPYWEADKYPKKENHRLFIGRLHDMGYHLGLWLCIEYDQSLVEEDEIALAAGRDTSGQEHWMNHLTKFIDNGVDGFKLDPARTIDEHTYFKYYNGRTDKEMHNLNQVLMPKQLEKMTRKHTNRRTWHHYCGGWAGIQRWSASTSGDNGGGRTALFDQLNIGMSGYMNTSCDVMSVSKDLEMQSLHFGLFLPWVQINSWYALLQPFYFPHKKQNTYRDYVKLRYSLMPYIYSTALNGHLNGMPIVRAMPLMFPDDRNCDDMTSQYMFGDNLLLSIFSDSIYLPKGSWMDYWTKEIITSNGEQITHNYPDDRAGLMFMREGAIIPFQQDMQFNGEEPTDSLIVRIFPKGESSYTMLEDDGSSYKYEDGAIARTRFDCKQNGNVTEFTVNAVEGSYEGMHKSRTYRLEFFNMKKPKTVKINGTATKNLTFENGVLSLTVEQKDTRQTARVSILH